jgi:catechol 2,3-dioxygenase-like lactoylglutathione lyase family enzyme
MVVALAVAVVALRTGATVETQGGDLAAGRVSHIGVVVRDIDAALREYVRVMGFSMPRVSTYPIPMPDGRKTEFKVATLYMPNFFVEIIQPGSPIGPYYDHMQAHGQSIQHMGLAVPGEGPIDGVRAALEKQGGRWVLGSQGTAYAYVNFDSLLGISVEVIHDTAKPGPAPAMPADGALPPLGALNVTHVGFGATDAAAVTTALTKMIGVPAPKVNEYRDSQYPPNAPWSKTAFLRLATWNQGGIGLEFIESVGGPTPWSEFVKQQKGTAAQHIAINVGNRMDEMIKDLVVKGGKWTNGKPGGNYAYLDFNDTLGLVFELNGTSKSAGGR